ncbi:unnamed protein product, partial [Sphagnum jensenii]
MVQLQDSILKHLHHHTLSSMLSNRTFETHHAQILSCFGPWMGIWFIIQCVFPTFQLSSLVFFTTFHMQLGLPHPSIANIFQCV